MAGEIEAFGTRLGLRGLQLGAQGSVSLHIDRDMVLTLQTGEGGQQGVLLMTLAAPVGSADAADAYVRCLERADVAKAPVFPFSVGLHRGELVFGVRLREKGLSAATLENALRFLLGQCPSA